MLYPIENSEVLESLIELISLQSQVKASRLQDKLGKQNLHEGVKKLFEPVTDTIENTSEDVTRTMMESSKRNNEALSNISGKLLEILNDRGVLASYLLSVLTKITNPERTSHFKLVKAPDSNRVDDLLINKTVPITLYDNLLTFRDIIKQLELREDLPRMITTKNYNVDHLNLSDKKLMFDFEKQL